MSKFSNSDDYVANTRRLAATAFEQHVITKQSEGRWLLQRMHEDGKPDWVYAAEIVVLANGSLYVGGDIHHIVFAYGPRHPIACVRWMGECEDLSYYVRQKAHIGMCGDDYVDRWEPEIAATALREWVADRIAEDDDWKVSDPGALESACRSDDRELFLTRATRALGGDYEAVSGMGEVLAPRVVYAHAALARLCALIRAQEASDVDERIVE